MVDEKTPTKHIPKAREATATYRFEYILEKDAATRIIPGTDENSATLVGYDTYVKPRDEDGYSPPKWVSEERTYELAEQFLLEINAEDEWIFVEECEDYRGGYYAENFTMETVHVFPEPPKDDITHEKVYEHKRTWWEFRIVRRTKKTKK